MEQVDYNYTMFKGEILEFSNKSIQLNLAPTIYIIDCNNALLVSI